MHDEPKVIIAGLTQPIRPQEILRHAGPYPSIAPSAIDVMPDSWRPPPRRNGLPIVLGVMGACATIAAIAGLVGVQRYRERQREEAAYAQKIAGENRRAAAPKIDPVPVVTAAPVAVDPVPVVIPDPPKPKPTVTAQPKPAPVVKTTATPKEQTGQIRTFGAAAGKAIFVDGKQAGVAPAPLSVKCGSHAVRVGEGKTSTVNVPCGGAITVGSPDGD